MIVAGRSEQKSPTFVRKLAVVLQENIGRELIALVPSESLDGIACNLPPSFRANHTSYLAQTRRVGTALCAGHRNDAINYTLARFIAIGSDYSRDNVTTLSNPLCDSVGASPSVLRCLAS